MAPVLYILYLFSLKIVPLLCTECDCTLFCCSLSTITIKNSNYKQSLVFKTRTGKRRREGKKLKCQHVSILFSLINWLKRRAGNAGEMIGVFSSRIDISYPTFK